MNEDLLYYITNHAGSLSVQELLINFFSALVIGFIIFLSYRFSHSGAVYNGRFNVSLWMLTIVTTMVMCVIGNNVALSLGMVGALSIVRFRTAIKDARDAAYIFWCIAVGICCGISDFVTASHRKRYHIPAYAGNRRSARQYEISAHCPRPWGIIGRS